MEIKTYTGKITAKTMELVHNEMGLNAVLRFSCLLSEADQSRLGFSGVRITPRVAKGLNDIASTTLARLITLQKIGKIMKISNYNFGLEKLSRNDIAQVQARIF